MISVKNLNKDFEHLKVLKDINEEIQKGEKGRDYRGRPLSVKGHFCAA